MDYFLSDEQKELQNLFRDFAEKRLRPVARELDDRNDFPHELIKEMARLDFMRIFVPEEYGGFGFCTMSGVLAMEQLSRVEAGTAICFGGVGLGTIPIVLAGTEEQKKRYLPKIADGEWYAGFGLTEADAGSDASNIKTVAVKRGDKYVLNGTKRFITNAGEAHVYTVIASTDPTAGIRGLSAFIVEKDFPGVSFGKKEDKLGIRASVQREIVFQDAEVPAENIMGREGHGFRVAMSTLDHSRPEVGAQALGIAQGAYEEAVKYAKERVQFGEAIANFQAVQFMLADMAIAIEASRALCYAAARYVDSGAKNVSKVSAMSKVLASDTAMKVTIDAVQVHGGNGFMREYMVEKFMRDAKITQIYEGTNQIQRLVIARNLLREF